MNNDIGTVDIDLLNTSWDSDAKYSDGEAVQLNGNNSRWQSQSSFGINNQQISWAGWYFDITSADGGAPVAWSSGGSLPSDGWIIEFRSGGSELKLRFRDGGNSTPISINTSLPDSFFFGLALDGNDAELYIWNETTQLFNEQGSGSRGDKGVNKLLGGGGRSDAGRFIDAVYDEAFVSTTTALSEQEFEDLWELTKP